MGFLADKASIQNESRQLMTQAREDRESQYRVIPMKLLGQLPPDGIVVVRVVETRVVDVAQNPRAVRDRYLGCTTKPFAMKDREVKVFSH